MIQQIKKRLFLLSIGIICIGFFSVPIQISSKDNVTTDVSEVAEQKSVIDEQAMMLPLEDVYTAPTDSESLDNQPESVDEEFFEGWVTTSVNVRSEPNTTSEILETLTFNKKVIYTKENEEWSKIQFNDEIAYIKTEYINEEENKINNPYYELINNLTEEEKILIYKITYAEAGNQCMEGQRAVIEVILNRVLSNKYPNTIKEVLSQSGQFVTWKNINSIKYNETQIEALDLVYNNSTILNENYLMFSRGKNSWGQNYIKIQDHWFGTF